MENRIKLKYCVIMNCFIFIMILITIINCNDPNSSYLNYGPNDNLYVLSIKINDKSKYIKLQVFLFLIECSRVFINEIASPILGFNIYNPDKKVITEFSKSELQLLANVMWFINNLTNGLFVMITISQIDIAILRILYSELTTVITIRLLLNEKTFVNDRPYHNIELQDFNVV